MPEGFPPTPSVVGYCEIGSLTGCESMWLFSSIFENDDLCRYGNCLYLSVKNKPVAAILFLGSDDNFHAPKLVTNPPLKNEEDFSSILTKMFDDDTIERWRLKNPENADDYSEKKINHLRSQAKLEYSKFLKTPLIEFLQSQFKNSFLGLMLDCAFHAGYNKNAEIPEQINPTLLPFAACVKLAFD